MRMTSVKVIWGFLNVKKIFLFILASSLLLLVERAQVVKTKLHSTTMIGSNDMEITHDRRLMLLMTWFFLFFLAFAWHPIITLEQSRITKFMWDWQAVCCACARLLEVRRTLGWNKRGERGSDSAGVSTPTQKRYHKNIAEAACCLSLIL